MIYKSKKPFLSQSKRCFQLLEIMIAMLLILICIVPVLRVYTNMYKQQVETVHEYDRDHLIHLIHAHFIEQLYLQAIPIEDILKEDSVSLQGAPFQETLKKLGYEYQYKFVVIKPVKDIDKAKELLIRLTFTLKYLTQPNKKPIDYTYVFYLDRGAQ